jgi:hypothetical protein
MEKDFESYREFRSSGFTVQKAKQMVKRMKDKKQGCEKEICPDCGGDGIVVGVMIEATCCGMVDKDGYCCGYPMPMEVPEPEQCQRCEATGFLPIEHHPLQANQTQRS